MTEKTQNADFRRKPQMFADSPFLLEIPQFRGRRKPQKTQIFAENRNFSQKTAQIGLRHLRSVTFSLALENFNPGGRSLILSIFGSLGKRRCCASKFANSIWQGLDPSEVSTSAAACKVESAWSCFRTQGVRSLDNSNPGNSSL